MVQLSVIIIIRIPNIFSNNLHHTRSLSVTSRFCIENVNVTTDKQYICKAGPWYVLELKSTSVALGHENASRTFTHKKKVSCSYV